LSVTYDRSEVSFANKTDRNDITDILLKVALNTKTLTLKRHLNYIYSAQSHRKIEQGNNGQL